MSELLVFAGTTEGRILLEALSRADGGSCPSVYVCVATDYGKELLPPNMPQIQVHSGRMTEEEMIRLMQAHSFDHVIDTTHPYATIASDNIKEACRKSGCSYLRVIRDRSTSPDMKQEDCLFFESHESVIEYLNRNSGNAVLAIGSKELHRYTNVRDYQDRLFPRVLPMPEIVKNCYDLGFSGRQLICMQGPFSVELNVAFLNQTRAKYLVTKDSGEPGGFLEKYKAVQSTGAVLLVIGRGRKEEGHSLESLIEFLEQFYQITLRNPEFNEPPQWFPFFTKISGRLFLVVGAGKIATRRIQTLLQFDCQIKVIAQNALPEVKTLAEQGRLELLLKPYESEDLNGADYVLAATDKKEVNEKIYNDCKEKDIIINVADCKEKSDFYFPGIVRRNGVTVGVTAEGKDHSLAKKATKAIAGCLDIG